MNSQWLKTRNTSKKVTSNYQKEKMPKKLKLLNLESMGISSPIFIFNQDPNKQAQDVIYSRKTKKTNHHPSNFSKSTVSQTTSQKHLGVFDEHLISVLRKTDKTIGLKLYNASFHWKLEKMQYNAFIAITEAICGTSKGKKSTIGLRMPWK